MHLDLDMGKYAFFVWSAYGATALGLIGVTVMSLRANRERRKVLTALQAAAKDAPEPLPKVQA